MKMLSMTTPFAAAIRAPNTRYDRGSPCSVLRALCSVLCSSVFVKF